jgi:hypothetical protein
MPDSPVVFTLEEGIKGWVKGGQPFTSFMDGYVPEYWTQFISGSGEKRTIDTSVADEAQEHDDHSPAKRSRNENPDDVTMA